MEARRVEKEEERYQKAVKKKLMDKAKLDMFRRQDRVKKLHSTMLMSDVLQERDLQKEIAGFKKKQEVEREAEHHRAVLANIKRLEEVEQRKLVEL